jgi:hypothetical protein
VPTIVPQALVVHRFREFALALPLLHAVPLEVQHTGGETRYRAAGEFECAGTMERECHGKPEREPDDKSWRESQKLNGQF